MKFLQIGKTLINLDKVQAFERILVRSVDPALARRIQAQRKNRDPRVPMSVTSAMPKLLVRYSKDDVVEIPGEHINALKEWLRDNGHEAHDLKTIEEA